MRGLALSLLLLLSSCSGEGSGSNGDEQLSVSEGGTITVTENPEICNQAIESQNIAGSGSDSSDAESDLDSGCDGKFLIVIGDNNTIVNVENVDVANLDDDAFSRVVLPFQDGCSDGGVVSVCTGPSFLYTDCKRKALFSRDVYFCKVAG